jgi:sensor histidine kinase YesM
MNPHFMFNSLNSIKTYILEARPDVAADYLSQFAHLIRRILQNSREKYISLREELETLQLYISLEQFRFEQAFEFECSVEDGIDLDHTMIPPMLLQPHVENAIWHGLMHQEKGGRLTLRFSQDAKHIRCVIDDNGIGSATAREMKSLSAQKHKSMGLSITKNRVQLMNRVESVGISIQIEDKQDASGNGTGTTVVVSIPAALGSENGIH